MPTIAGTWAERLAWAVSMLGQSRTTDAGRQWTPSLTIDDCALFQSAIVYGPNSQVAWNVDGFKTAPHGTYHAGDQGLRPGDVLLFDWDGNGVGNHTECVTKIMSPGVVQTIGSNGSDTISVSYRTRSTQYVLGYFRPQWPTAPAGKPAPAQPATPAFNPLEDPSMPTIIGTETGQTLALEGTFTTFKSPDDVRNAMRSGIPVLQLTNEHLERIRKEAARK